MGAVAEISLGNQIKEARLKKGLTQKQVEESLNWSIGILSKYEKETIRIPEDKKDALFEYLGLGEEKVADFFNFKTTKTPPPVNDDNVSVKKNGEGYADPTMAAALKKANVKFTDHMPGEIWLHQRRNGSIVKKLIISLVGNSHAFCISMFSTGYASNYQQAFKVKTRTGNVNYISLDRLEVIPLKELTERTDVISEKWFEKAKAKFADLLDVPEKVKEVEVVKYIDKPVEVVKEVEKPVEIIKEVEKVVEIDNPDLTHKIDILERELAIYKDMIDRVLPAPTRYKGFGEV